jgi:hypothetical protein
MLLMAGSPTGYGFAEGFQVLKSYISDGRAIEILLNFLRRSHSLDRDDILQVLPLIVYLVKGAEGDKGVQELARIVSEVPK